MWSVHRMKEKNFILVRNQLIDCRKYVDVSGLF